MHSTFEENLELLFPPRAGFFLLLGGSDSIRKIGHKPRLVPNPGVRHALRL